MASVFLSYDHEDAKRASPIVAALERAGHSVWWDQHIRAGCEYNHEIDGAVERADAVVVLWTERSVRSAWVRDEAAEGRDRGKLLPVTLDAVKPPMGFRQYQTIDLSKAGRAAPHIDTLLEAIDKLGSRDSPSSPPPPKPSRHERRRFPRDKWLMVAALVVLMAGAGIGIWRLLDREPSMPVVAVLPAERSADADALARNLFVNLGSLQPAKTATMRLVGVDNRGRSPDFIFETSGSGSRDVRKANLALLAGKDRVLLWSRDWAAK